MNYLTLVFFNVVLKFILTNLKPIRGVAALKSLISRVTDDNEYSCFHTEFSKVLKSLRCININEPIFFFFSIYLPTEDILINVLAPVFLWCSQFVLLFLYCGKLALHRSANVRIWR